MIRPNMATMLSFLATDAGIAQPLLRQLAIEIADASFNRITVDGDTMKDGTVTLRERDSMQQKRITEAELFQLLDEQVY